jgi:hypothetical protein
VGGENGGMILKVNYNMGGRFDSAADGAERPACPRSLAPKPRSTRTPSQQLCARGAEVERSSVVLALAASAVRALGGGGRVRGRTLSAASTMTRAAISRSTTSEWPLRDAA